MKEELYGKIETYGLWYELFKESLLGMNIGLPGDVDSSGEENVCKLLANLCGEIKTAFDVGANSGEYSKMLRRHFPDAKIHCFEPAKKTFEVLKKNIGEKKDIIINNIAISDEAGLLDLYYDKEISGLASLYKRQLEYLNIDFTKSEKVLVETLDAYCERNHIDNIDFLKMDIEGNEFSALRGGKKLLTEKCIGAIQIEFGGCNIDSRTFFRDFWNLLHKDFFVYRILKNGFWEITNYTERLECFCCTNYIFVRKDMKKRE